MSATFQGICPLPHLGVIRAMGPDTLVFLQGQLTQDVLALGGQQAHLAGYCSPKGRLLASFVTLRIGDDEVWLVCDRSVLAATLKRLGLFVLRAKTRLTDHSGEVQCWGALGSVAQAIPWPSTPAWTQVAHEGGWAVHLPAAPGHFRALWVAPAGVPPWSAERFELADWQWAEVQSGVAQITAPLVDALVPQMLNFESVGGVSFKKGCYPGQEVVARSQFRGSVKRRAFLVDMAERAQAGDAVFHSSNAEQACGVVVQAASHPSEGFSALVSMPTALSVEGQLHLGAPDGALITVKPLPYALLTDV